MCSTIISKLLKHTQPHLFLTQSCTSMKELTKIHAQFITSGLCSHNLFLSTILSFTALSPAGDLSYAHLLFNQIDSPNVFMYNTMIRGYAYSNMFSPMRALTMYVRMLRSGIIPNNYTYPFVNKALCKIENEKYGEIMHCSIVKYGHVLDLHVVNSLLHMYASFGLSNEVSTLFGEIPRPDVVSWNVVIDDLAQNGCFDEVLDAFSEMWYHGVEPSSVSILGLVSACAKTGDLGIGKLIHSYLIKKVVHVGENLGNGLLDLYAKFGDMESAVKLFNRMQRTVFSWTSMVDGYVQKGDIRKASGFFNQMPEKDTTAWNVMLSGYIEVGDMPSAESIFSAMSERDLVSWNSMVVGYAQDKQYVRCLELLKAMLDSGMKPDRITLDGLFAVCGHTGVLCLGEMMHSCMEKLSIKGEEVEVALMDMYCKCGAPENAKRVFWSIGKKSVLAWSAMIIGLATNGLSNEALELFHQMCDAGVRPNEITFIGVLSACCYAGLVEKGKWFLNAMNQEYGVVPRSEHYGCVVDILGRAGLVKEAEIFIQNLPDEADAGVWGALLGVCGVHGEVQIGEKVAKILTEMDPYHSGRYVLLSNIYASENRWLDAQRVRMKMNASGVRKTPGFSLLAEMRDASALG